MKKEGMMRLSGEEITGLAQGSGISKLIFLLIVFHSSNFPQIPINGFCKYNSFVIDSGYTSLFQINYNNDPYSDLVLFNSSRTDILVLEGDANGIFSRQKKYTMPVQFSSLENIINQKNVVTGYFFVSRKSMKAGLLKFNESGRPDIDKEIKLTSYPDFISIADYNNNNKQEYLISGSSFDGISLLYEKDNTLEIKKIVQHGSYSKALFSDISNDGYPDIAAFNLMSNSIDFYYNNPGGNFYKVRSLPFETKLDGFKITDIDLDGYEDIIITQGKNIKIYFGDFTSSFDKEIVIKTDFRGENILTADYNKDGFIDIAYFDKKEGLISIIFASAERTFFKEVVYLKKKDLEKIIPFYSKFINGIIALSSSGTVYSITNLASVSGNVNLTAGVSPSAIGYFDNHNDGIIDYSYMDTFDQKLKIVLRNKEGIPAHYYSYPLFGNYTDFIIEDVSNEYKKFYCYSPGSKLIEIIEADFGKGNFKRSSIYSPGNLVDIKLDKDEEKNTELFIAFVSGLSLGVTKVKKVDLKYVFTTTVGISSNIRDAWFGRETSSNLFYWSRRNNNFQLSRLSYKRVFDDIRDVGSLNFSYDCSITGFTGNLLNNGKDQTVSFVKCSDERFTISASDSLFLTLDKNLSGEWTVANRHQLFYGEIRFSGLKKLLYSDQKSEKVFVYNFLNNGRQIVSSEFADAPGIRSFFVKNMNFRNYHLVYTNSKENCITIVQL